MKPLILTFSLLVYLSNFAQEKTKPEDIKLDNFVQQCDAIAKTLIDKTLVTMLDNWYEGNGKEIAERAIKQLENDIDSTSEKVAPYLMILSTNPLIFSLHFYYTDTETEFGHMFIFFKNQENNLVDDLQFVSKSYYEINSIPLGMPNAISSSDSSDD